MVCVLLSLKYALKKDFCLYIYKSTYSITFQRCCMHNIKNRYQHETQKIGKIKEEGFHKRVTSSHAVSTQWHH